MNNMLVDKQTGIYEGILGAGKRLSELPEDQGGWAEWFSDEKGHPLHIPDPTTRAQTALMLENCKQWMATICRARPNADGLYEINEATRSALVGGFSDYLFPIIRAAFPTNPINELVSIQPTNRRVATVVYWNYMIGSNKGVYQQGQRIFDANVGRLDTGHHYSDEVIEGESVTSVLTSGSTVATGQLQYNDGGGVRPNTVAVAMTTAAGAATIYDNGNGGFTASGVTLVSGNINYATGVLTFTISGTTITSAAMSATYMWDSEGSLNLPQLDVQITTSTVETQRRAMLLNYSIEAMQDVMAEFGVALEPNLIQAASEELNYEIARQIIHDLWMVAPVSATFPITGPQYISQQQYFGDFIYYLNRASNSIWERTQKAYANWMVVDSGAASMIESLPNNMFEAAPRPPSVQGLHFVGILNKRWRIYKDLLLRNEPNASVYGNILIGFKGTNFWEAGYVHAPYQQLYTTDSIPTAGFTVNKGLATRVAGKLVNANMYSRIALAA